MTSMRSVSPEGSHVQSVSEHNSFPPWEIVEFINNDNNKINMQSLVLEFILQCIVNRLFSLCKNLHCFNFNYCFVCYNFDEINRYSVFLFRLYCNYSSTILVTSSFTNSYITHFVSMKYCYNSKFMEHRTFALSSLRHFVHLDHVFLIE